MASNHAPDSQGSGWDTVKTWLGLGPVENSEPWAIFIASLAGAAIVATIGWLIFDFEFAVIVFIVGALNGAYQEFRSRKR